MSRTARTRGISIQKPGEDSDAFGPLIFVKYKHHCVCTTFQTALRQAAKESIAVPKSTNSNPNFQPKEWSLDDEERSEEI